MKSFVWQRNNWFIALSFLFLLAFSFAACTPRGSSTPTSAAGTGTSPISTPSTTSIVKIGTQPCPKQVQDPAHWDAIIPTQRPNARVESVSCGNLLNNPSLQALVTVRHSGSDKLLDVSVYTNITGAHPTQLFKLQGLNRGQAKISSYTTVITAEVDLHSSLNTGQPPAKLTLDLFREFRGFDTAGTFVQVSFPGLFPDLTRWQAEADQQTVNHGQDSWKLDPMQTAQRFADQVLHPGGTTTLVSGGGRQDLDALVNLTFQHPGGSSSAPITRVTLSRLQGNTKGIWEVTALTANGLFISSPQSGLNTRISNPVTVSGFGPQFESQVGQVLILDHLYNQIGQGLAMGTAGFAPGPFSVSVPYQASFQGGAQEGIVELTNVNGIGFEGAVMLKALVNA